jgi:hypothetical protein
MRRKFFAPKGRGTLPELDADPYVSVLYRRVSLDL